jgi:hypothetical protein
MFGPEIAFANTTAYRSYRIIVKSQRGSDNGVQYSEMNLIGVRDAVPPQVVDGSFDVLAPAVAVRFSEDVSDSLGADDLVVKNTTTGEVIPSGAMGVTWDGKTRTARWTFPGYPGGLPDGNYHATLSGAGVSDLALNALASPFPVDFFVLAGDASGDRQVDFLDLAALAQHYNIVGGQTFDEGDFNYDGNVDFLDLALLAQRYNTGLAAPAVAAPVVSAAPVAAPVFSTSRIAPVGRRKAIDLRHRKTREDRQVGRDLALPRGGA